MRRFYKMTRANRKKRERRARNDRAYIRVGQRVRLQGGLRAANAVDTPVKPVGLAARIKRFVARISGARRGG